MSNANGEYDYDKQFWDIFTELLVNNGCPQDKADEFRESMLQPRKRTFGDLTVRELWGICADHPECENCPLNEFRLCRLCTGYYWSIDKYTLDREVDL